MRADAIEKRKRKGYLFTIGDEPVLDVITKEQVSKVFGVEAQADINAVDALRMVSRDWEVFHIILANEGYCRSSLRDVVQSWKALLPERAVQLDDVDKLAETIARVHEDMATHDSSDYEGLQRRADELTALEADVEALEERWLELSDSLS